MPLTIKDIRDNQEYQHFLVTMGKLSNLFSDNVVPFLHYRLVENLFCKCFEAKNLARDDTSYDSIYHGAGIGIKTFMMPTQKSYEKVAEFDKRSSLITSDMSDLDVVKLVAEWRNDRIMLANRMYGISEDNTAQYHCVARQQSCFLLFNTSYDCINQDTIRLIKAKTTNTISFTDGINNYRFSRPKSTLYKEFALPSADEIITLPVRIVEDPFALLKRLEVTSNETATKPYVILPLYSTRCDGEVAAKSGLNQWNAAGRIRDPDEVYIPIPIEVHRKHPDFFPERDEEFELILPDKTCLRAKVCQENRKALMSNPNSALGEWLLRTVFNLQPGELLTRKHLDIYGMDSIVVEKENENRYYLRLTTKEHYEDM